MSHRRTVLLCVIVACWSRVLLVLSAGPFETPDTQSYRSGQGTRPPVGAALLSWLGSAPYVALSVVVSTAGFAALAWALWNPARHAWSYTMVGAVAVMSFVPGVMVYEHWLVPDSLLLGFALLGLAFAWRHLPGRWHPAVLLVLCLLLTGTKEQGIGVVVLIALVLSLRGSYRVAIASVAVSALLFLAVVQPSARREGTVLWDQPPTTELTMHRFRVVIASLMWPDLSPALAEVGRLSTDCGMDLPQLTVEVMRLADHTVSFEGCPELWAAVDDVSQVDVLTAHLRHPGHVGVSIERGFAPDMWAMAHWSAYPFEQRWVLAVDRALAATISLLPLFAAGVCLARRRGRRLAGVALLGSCMALVAALVDPTSQDRHTIVFRLAAAAVALMALSRATQPEATAGNSEQVDRCSELVPM